MTSNRRPYIVLVFLVLLFAMPGIAAYFFYHHPHWLSTASTNKGAFVNPPILVHSLEDNTKWRLILWHPQACDNDCMDQLNRLARIRLALGRRLYDVNVCLLTQNAALLSASQQAVLKDADIKIVPLESDDINIDANNPTSLTNTPMLYIANPDKYLVLAYTTTAPADDMFHDIKLLLKKE